MNYSNQKRLSLTELRRRVRYGFPSKFSAILRIATPSFIYWSSSAGITTYRASKLSAILRDATPGLTYSIERCTTITSLKLSGSALETDSVVDDDAAASIPPWRRDQDWGCLPWGWPALQTLATSCEPWTRNTMDLPPPLHLEAPPLRTTKCCPVKLWGIQSLNKEYYGPSQSTHTFTRPSSMVHSHHHCTWRRLHFEVAHVYWTVYLHGRN